MLRLKARIEALTGNTITAAKLQAAIKLVNDKRRALQRLNRLRQADPAPISGRDALLINQVSLRRSGAFHRQYQHLVRSDRSAHRCW